MGASLMTPSAVAAESGIQSADCNTWSKRGTTGYAYCSGLGTVAAHRVKIVCVDTRGVESTFYGKWVGNAKTSSRKCPGTADGRVGILRVGSQIQD
ncbi:hypothetical protein [Streptomyces dysideae]|nr:hypothetical protein [Streptomyces dysideae]